MVKKMVHITFFFFLCHIKLQAQDLLQILQNRSHNLFEKGTFFPQKIAVMKQPKDAKKAYAVTWKNYQPEQGLDMIPGNIINWSWLLNGHQYTSFSSPEEHAHKIMKTVDANIMIMTDKKKWQLFAHHMGQTSTLSTHPRPKKINRQTVRAWLTKAFGYNAMVIGKQNALYFIRGTQPFENGEQGIIYQKSSKELVLQQHGVLGILEVVDTRAHYALAKIILGKIKKLEPGTKIKMIPRSENLKKLTQN